MMTNAILEENEELEEDLPSSGLACPFAHHSIVAK
jgi:hypothetical protein